MHWLRCRAFRAICLALVTHIVVAQSPAENRDAFQKGLLALQAEHLEEALAAFDTAEKQHPDDPQVHNFRGITLMSLGKMEEAAEEYRRATQLDANLESAFRNLGYLEWTANRTASAREDLQHALTLAPDDAFAAYYLSRLESADGHPAAALSILERFSEKHRSWAQFDLALAHLQGGEYAKAAAAANAELQNPASSVAERAVAQSIAGIAEARLHNDKEAVAAFRAATALAPGQEEFWLNLTRQLMEMKRLAEAIESVQQGLAANPKSYALHLRLGAAYFAADKYGEAEATFRELTSAGDPLPTSAIGLAQVLLHTGRAAEAADVLGEAEHRLGPQFLIVYFEALAQDHAGRRAEALQAFQRAVELNPKSVEAHLGVGKTSLLLGKIDEAIEELQWVVNADPGNLPARRLLSRAYARKGDQANASRYATEAVTSETEPESNMVGDFILPEWQQPQPD